MSPEDFSTELDEVRRGYADAVEWQERYGDDDPERKVASINQLRYVGQHILKTAKALNEGSLEEVALADEIRKAVNHAGRAANDARDSAVLSALERIRSLFNWKFASGEFQQGLRDADFRCLYEKLANVRSLLESAGMPGDIQKDDPVDKALTEALPILEKLESVANGLIEERDARARRRNQIMERHQKQEVAEHRDREQEVGLKRKRQTWLLLCLSLLAVILTAMGFVL